MSSTKICERRSLGGRIAAFVRPLVVVAALFLGAGAVTTASAQGGTNRVSGQVVSNGESVIGASVVVKGTTVGTVADVDGFFSLQARPDDILVVSAIGYVFHMLGFENTSAREGALVFFIKPMLAPIFALIFLHEEIPPIMWAGIVLFLIGAGIAIGLIPLPGKKKEA